MGLALLSPILLVMLSGVVYRVRSAVIRMARGGVEGDLRDGYDENGTIEEHHGKLTWWHRCVRSLLFLRNLQFFGFIMAALTPLSCQWFEGEIGWRMTNVPYESCSEWKHWIGVVSLVVYGIGGPCLIGIVATHGSGSSSSSMAVLDQFRTAYRVRVRFWELVLILRRIVFVGVSVLIPMESPFRALSQGAVLVMSGLVHMAVHPFMSREENEYESVSHALLVVNLLLCMSARVSRVSMAAVEAASTVVLVLNVLFVIVVAIRIAEGSRIWKWIRKGRVWRKACCGTRWRHHISSPLKVRLVLHS
jgi:hypothetical protein